MPDQGPSGLKARAPSDALVFVATLLLAFPVLFLHVGSWGFFDPDEGRYAEIPFEMLARGDFVTPTLNYVPYFEKPPLFYWLVAGAYRTFGYHAWAGRLVPVLSGVTTLWLAFVLGRRMFGLRGGLYSVLILGTTLMWAAMARLLIVDGLFSTLVFLALVLFWLGHSRPTPRCDAAFWVVLGLAVLAKGPVAVVLVLGSISLYAVLGRRFKDLLRPGWLAFAPLALIVAAPWFVLVAGRNPGFNDFFWYRQHIGRFLGLQGSREHDHGALYFLGLLPIMLFPWSLFLPGALLSGSKRLLSAWTEKRRALLFLCCGVSFITLFFSVSVSKLPQYLLPVLPLAAVASGGWFDWARKHPAQAWGRSLRRSPLRGGAIALVVVLALLIVACFALAPRLLRELEGVGPGRAIVTGLVLLFWGAAVVVAQARRDLTQLMAATAGGVVMLIVWLTMLTIDFAPNHYCKSLLDYVRPGLDSGATLIASDSYLPSVGFYTGRRLLINGPAGEVTFGMSQIPESERRVWFSDGIEDLRARLSGPAPVYVLVRDHETARELVPRLGDGVREIVWNKRRSILGNAPAAQLTRAVGSVAQLPEAGNVSR